jgi:signal transduction histidine kinase
MNPARRWLVPLGVLTIAAVVIVEAMGEVGFGTTGNGLLVVTGASLFAASGIAYLMWSSADSRVAALLLAVMAVGGILMHHGDPGGPVVSLFLTMAFAPFRLTDRAAAVVATVVIVSFNVDQVVTLEDPWMLIVSTDLGAAFFFLLGSLVRTEAAHRQRAEQLIHELERTRLLEQEAAVLSERARIARDMHDVLAHTMSGLVLQLEGARLLARERTTDRELRDVIDRSVTLARDGSAEARRAVATLRGEELPGPEQLPQLVVEHHRMGGRAVNLSVEGVPRLLEPQGRLALYRAVQESLANVRKHAPDASVEISISWHPSHVDLEIQDDGGTTGSSGLADGHGLTGMSERATALGGRFSAGWNGPGFRVQLCLPTGGRP